MTSLKGTKSYHARYQVKRRRRREGKTDYKHRTNMIRQDLNKYGAAKYRLVVRITNSKVICQIVNACIEGDRIFAYADSTELKNYGIDFGLTNYSAAYLTGYLIGRRALTTLKLDKVFEPKCVDGEIAVVEDIDDERRAFKCYLDIGLSRSSKGANVFGAMKGASDACLAIPHSEKIFCGYKPGEPFNCEELCNRIYGKNISDYMIQLRDCEPEKYKKQFGQYIRKCIEPESLKERYMAAIDKIAQSPHKERKEKRDYSGFKRFKAVRLTLEQRKERVRSKLASLSAQ